MSVAATRNGLKIRLGGKLINRRKISWIGAAVTCIVLGALSSSQAPQPQSVSPKIKMQQAIQPQDNAVKIKLMPVPDLNWLSRRAAPAILANVNLMPGQVTDDGVGTSVVIAQNIAPGQLLAPGSKVDYTVGQPKLVLKPSSIKPKVNDEVHFEAELAPAWTRVDTPAPVTYTFFWKQDGSEAMNQPQSGPKSTADYRFAEPGNYMVFVVFNDFKITSKPVEIHVQPAKTAVTPTPTPAPSHTPKPSPTKSATPDGTTTHPNVPDPARLLWRAVLKAILLVMVVLGTLAFAYRIHKRNKQKNAREAKDLHPAAPKVKVSIGNRQIEAKILEPQQLKSKCLTRMRWVRGPVFSRMLPQEKIVKKKGAAHG